MIETASHLPLPFWVGATLLLYGMNCAVRWMRYGIGLPMITVLVTVAVWYFGDAFYNDYAGNYSQLFTDDILEAAWWQVALFVAVFVVVAPYLHNTFNAPYMRRGSYFYELFRKGIDQPVLQQQLNALFVGCLVVWLALVSIAIIRLKGESLNFFLPFLSYKADPWGRGRLGSGIDALLSLASYLQMFISTIFGIVAALATDRRVRFFALLLCLIAWPFYIFDRARNSMLAVIMPGFISWIFLRYKSSLIQKFTILSLGFLLVNAWFGFIIANRSGTTITGAFRQEGFNIQKDQKVHHEGLNMFEELCWINTFLKRGDYDPPWGERYFAELVNPIPRSIWPEKPMIAIDYAVARGQAYDAGGAGVGATISTGMIGQGVVNFRQFFGPIFAALLMAIWAVILSRLDLQGHLVGRLPLFSLGLILTFNLGRDITLITLYTFCFGLAVVWWIDRSSRQPKQEIRSLNFPNKLPRYWRTKH